MADVMRVEIMRVGEARSRSRRLTIVRQKQIVVGAALLIALVLSALAAPILATDNPNVMAVTKRLQSPGADHLFGTDGQGRDIYSRVVYGARLSLGVGFAVSLATLLSGTFIGLVAGLYRKVDPFIMRIMDGMMAFPSVILAISIMAARGAKISNVILALTVVATPRLARIVRSVVLGLAETPFVEAARATGNTGYRIAWRYVLPNCLSPIIVQTSFVFAEAVLGEATLSFLGAGAPADLSSWGTMLSDSRSFLQQAPWTMIFPGLGLVLTVLSLNLLGDGLRDLLDPRLRQR